MRRDDFLIGPKEKAIQAIKADNKEEAIKYVEQMNQEAKGAHDRAMEWIQSLLNYTAVTRGEAAVEEILKRSFDDVYKSRRIAAPKIKSAEDQVRIWCQVHRIHYSNFYVEEDDEKFVVVITFCGSGGKLHDEDKPGKTKDAYPWSFNQRGVTYYCCHEPVFEATAAAYGLELEDHAYKTVLDKNGKEVGHECRWTIYKNNKGK